MEEKKDIQPGDIVQIKVEYEGHFPGCLFVVEDVKSFGFQGYTVAPNGQMGLAYCRFNWSDFELTGGKSPLHKEISAIG